MRIRLSAVRRLAAALIWGGLLSLPAHAAGRKTGGALVVVDDLVGGTAGTVRSVGGAFVLDGTLSQVATSSSQLAVSPFTVAEAGYFTMMATTPVTSTILPVSSNTVTVQWSVSNPAGTAYIIDASSMPNFTGTVISTAAYNSSLATIAGLRANTTYYLRYKAEYMEGDETDFYSLGSTRTLSDLPAGCALGFNVRKDGFGDFTTISAAVAALPTSLSAPTCVVVRDTQIYSEQVVVQGFTNNNFQLRIMSDPSFISSAPVVSPPATMTAGFVIRNASVTLQGFMVRPSAAVPYGVQASSAYVTISSVNVDGGAFINLAGIAISSWSAVSYSSVAVGSAHGFRLDGSTKTTVSYSTAVINSSLHYSLYLDGGKNNDFTVFFASNSHGSGTALYALNSDTNTVTQSFLWGGLRGGLLDAGADFNTIKLSTVIGNADRALFAFAADSNTVTQSYLWGLSVGAWLDTGSDHNVISLSTMIGNLFQGLYAVGADSNTVTQSYIRGSTHGAWLDIGADRNAISLSTMIGTTDRGLLIQGGSSNTVTQSYMEGSINGAALSVNSNYNAISFSTMNGNSQSGLIASGSDWNTLTQSYLRGGSYGFYLDAGSDYNAISFSTMIGSSLQGFYALSADSNTATQSYLWGGQRGLFLDAGSDYNVISLSTMVGNSLDGFYALTADWNAVTQCSLQGAARGALLDTGSDFNAISFSTMVSDNASNPALYLLRASSNTISNSYVQGSTAAFISESTGTVINSSVLIATNTTGSAVIFQGGSVNLTVASTTLRGGPFGRGLLLDVNNSGRVSIGSVTVTGSLRGLEISTQGAGFVLAVDSITFRSLSVGATAIHFLGGTFSSTITLAGFSDASVGANVSAAALNPASRIAMFAHNGTRTGPPHENDPNNIVGWEAGPQPGCVVTRNVGAAQPFNTITGGLAALPSTLTGHSCVVIRDGATYNEQVTVSGFINNGSSITIMSDPALGLRPVVSPPALSTAAFLIRNASVTLQGFTVRPNVSVPYGVQASSAYVTISSVNVDSGGHITTAGIFLSSWSALSYSSVTVQAAHGIHLSSSIMTTVSYSTAANNSTIFYALYFAGADSNTVTGSYITNPAGFGARLDSGADYNTISQSTMTGSLAGSFALYLLGADSNTVTGSYISNPGGFAAHINTGSDYNTISQSTMVSNSVGDSALFFNGADSNTVTGSYISNPAGYGAYFNAGADYNTISQSTMTSNSLSASALFVAADSNTVRGSYVSNPPGNGARLDPGADYNMISQSTITNSSLSFSALHLSNASTNSITASVIDNGLGTGVLVENSANWNSIERSVVRGAPSGIKTQFLSGLNIGFSTVTGGNGQGTAGIWGDTGTEYITVSQSYVQGSTAVYLNGSSRTIVNASVLVGGGGGGLYMTGGGTRLSMSSNTVLGGGASGIGVDQNVSGLITLSTNTIIARTAPYAVGIAQLNAAASVWITSNTIVPSLSASATTYGVYFAQLPGGATMQNNGIYYRTAGAALNSLGAGAYALYADNVTGLRVDHNRISNPAMVTAGNFIGAAISQSPNAIFKFNDLHSTGGSLTTFNLLRLTGSANVSARNNILSSSMTATNNRMIVVDAPSQTGFSSDYNTFFSSNASYSGIWGVGPVSLLANWISVTGRDANSLSSNPLWLNPEGEDFHPLSRGGRWNGAVFAPDAVSGSGLDRGDPAEPVLSEVAPNGVRANQGSYGQTSEASQSVLPCPLTFFVRQGGDGDVTKIQDGINSLPGTLPSHSCIVIGDSGVYNEQVTVQGFTNNGSSITIMSDPSLTVPPIVRSGFIIRNASVNVVGIDIATAAPAVGMNYGIFASSANIKLSSVNVRDPGGFIFIAGVALSSYSSLSYSSISVQGAHGVRLDGKFAAVSYSTMTSNSSGFYALYLSAADSNTVTGSYISNTLGHSAYLENGADYNTISQSSIASVAGGFIALAVTGSDFNTVTGSFVSNPAGYGAYLNGGADFNSISFSTMTSNSASPALYLFASGSNTVTASMITNPAGYGVWLNAGSNYNTISLSTLTSNATSVAALDFNGSRFNTVTASYISNTTGYGARLAGGSDSNAISLSTMATNSPGFMALYVTASASNTVTTSFVSNPSGIALSLESGANYNAINQSTMTSGSTSGRALDIFSSDFNTVTGSFVMNPAGYAARLVTGSDFNRITLSTVTSTASGYSAVLMVDTASNTIQTSYIQGSTAAIISGSTGTAVNSSVLVATNTVGHALVLQGGSRGLALSSNTIIPGTQGAGIYLDAFNVGAITASTNVIHGGRYGLYVATQQAGTTVWITSNTIVLVPSSSFIAYGAYLNGLVSGATIQNNAIVHRSPGATATFYTAGIDANSSAGLVISRNRISNPGMVTGNALGVGLTGTPNTIFKYNDVHSTGTSISGAYHMRLTGSPGAQLRGNVFSSSWSVTNSTAALFVDAASQAGFFSDYNSFFSSNSFNSIEWGAASLPFPWTATIGRDGNSIARHPRWKDPSPGVEDFHHLSQAGRWNGTAFVLDGFTSDLIDKADSAESSADEAAPNGARANLGSYGNTSEASKSPASPASPAVAAVFGSSVSVSYSLVGADGYLVIASTASNITGTLFSSSTANNALAVLAPQGLAANTTYYLRTGAVWGDFNGFAATIATATLANPPGAFSPTFTAIATSALTVNWTVNGNPLGSTYTIVLSTGFNYPNAFAGNIQMSTTSFAAPLTGLAPNTTYFAFGAGINWNGMSSAYAALGSTSTLAAAPATTVSTFSNVGFSSFTVNWSASGNPLAITTYTVSVSTDSFLTISVEFTTAPAFGPSATFTDLNANELYYFRVRALNHQGVASPYASVASTVTKPVSLSAPAVAGLPMIGVSSIAATWSLSPLATGYQLVASLTNDPSTVFASSSPVGINATTATVFTPALSANTTYFLFVRALGPGAQTAYSSFGSTSTLAEVPLTAASTYTAVHVTSMTVAWLPNGNPVGVTSYTVVLSTGASYPNAFAGNRTLSTAPAGAAPAASVGGLEDNTTYYLYVRAVNHNGVGGAFTTLGSTITAISPPATVYFDEISSTTIVASAYAPTPLFSNLGAGQSGTRVARNGVYQAFHGEAWGAATALPAARHDAAAAGFNNKVYLFGGFEGAAAQSTVRVYDPATGVWTLLAPQPSARTGHAAAAASGKIYALGGTSDGFTSLNTNEEYDPVSNAWTAKTPLATRSDHLAAVAVGETVYAFAGVTDGADNSKNAAYDPLTNSWTNKLDFPAARHQMAAGAASGASGMTIVAAGGSGPSSGNFAYDAAGNTWTAKSALPASIGEGAAAAMGGKIFVVGGSPARNSVYEFDPATNQWAARASMATGRGSLSAAAAGSRVYALGGTTDGGATSMTTVEEYDPGTATKFTGLSPNTQAGFKAQARNSVGTRTAETATVSTWTWAAPPSPNVSPFTVVDKDSITVSWASNGNPVATEFKARASTSAAFAAGATVSSSDWGVMNSTSTLSLTPNTTYFLQSKARNGVAGVPGIETAWIALGSTATLAAVPAAAPVPFNTTTNALTVSWLTGGNPVSVTSYTVVVTTGNAYPNANTGNVVLITTVPAGPLPTATLAGLVANTTYFAFASAVNHNGLRTAYTVLGSTSTLALAPAAAAPAFSGVNQSSVTFSWLANGNPVAVTTYSVVLTTSPAFPNSNGGNVLFSTTPAGALPTATASAGISLNTTYYAFAAAINWNGAVSAYTTLGATATLAAAPATVASTFTAVNISSLTVSWSASGNPLAITTYTVQLSTAADFNAFATSFAFATAPVSGPSATFTGLADYTQYFFRVRAFNHGATATAWIALGSTTTLIAPLGIPAPAGFASVDITSITSTWGLVTGATGYTLVASTYPANPPTIIAASSTTFSIAATTAAALAPALSPNTTYFLFVRANGPLRSSLFAAYVATSTLASTPATAVTTFTGVGITSFTVNWNANGNALAITTYTVQLSTAPDFNAFATSVTFTTVPAAGPSAMITGLSGNTSYYLRIRSINNNGVPSAYASLGSTLTVASPLFPTVLNSQTGDVAWRRTNTALYSVGFLDTSGAHLDKFQVKASTTPGGLGSDLVPFTDVVVGLIPSDTYSVPWALPASVFNGLLEGVTNYISVRVFNGPPLNNFTVLQDAFYVQKDTTPPVIVNTQTGDSTPRSVAGTTYMVAVRDPSSGLAAFQYSASLNPGTANAALIGWTNIAAVGNTTSYATPWTVNFAALGSGVTNYISVRSWDTAGATTTLTDAFFVHKDTTGPTVAIAAPQTGAFHSALTTLSGTAASIYGVKGTEVSILDVLSGFYWNPASLAFNSAAPIMMAAVGGTNWTLAPGISWTDGASYRAVARSSTTAGLYSTTYATSTFIMDLSKPAVAVQAPVPNSTVSALPVLSGTAADPAPNPSGLSSVEVRLRRNPDGLWWNWFTQTWSPTAVSSITAGTTAWSLSPTAQLKASLAHGTSYFIAARASDNALPANQGDFFVSGATFTWQDTTPPSAVTNLAASHGAVPGSVNLSWTAQGDDGGAGIVSVGEYRIFYSTNIAAAASTAAAQILITTAAVNPGDAQAYTLTGLTPGVTYYVKLALADSDSNWSAFSNQASTTAAPSPLNAITGHVVDISTIGITAVQVDCYNTSDALVGTTFTLADGSGTFSVGSLPAGSYKLRVTWTVNGFSSSLWQDGIAMGSTNVDFVLQINYALATLTGTLGTLTSSSFGAGGLGTASASDSFIELYQQGRQVARTSVRPTGRWDIPNLLPGAYSVRAFTGLGYTPFQNVTLVEGEVRVLGFVFNPLPEASVFAFPNPARTSTTIRFETALAPLEAGIFIFDIAGNLVKEISNSQINRAAAPVYRVEWDLNNANGRAAAPGVYHVMVKVKGGSEDQTAKVIKKLAVVR